MLWFSLCGLEENWYLWKKILLNRLCVTSPDPKNHKSHQRNPLHNAVMGDRPICLKPAHLSVGLLLLFPVSQCVEDMAPLRAVLKFFSSIQQNYDRRICHFLAFVLTINK